jgi:hypothetical protein
MNLFAMYDDSSVEIEGTEEALRQFSREIEQCDGTRTINLPYLAGVDKRGLSYATAITVLLGDGLVNIALSNGEVVISGSKEKLNLLVYNVVFLADSRQKSPISNHLHIEYIPDGFPFLADTALPLVVTKQEDA